MIDPLLVTLVFMVIAAAFRWRGKVLEKRIVTELRDLSTDGIKVLWARSSLP